MTENAIQDIHCLLSAASSVTDLDAKTIYLAKARNEIDRLKDATADVERLLVAQEKELRRVS